MNKKNRQYYDLSSATFRANPHETYAAMRDDQPMMRLKDYQGNVWFVTGYEEARLVLSDQKRFVKNRMSLLPAEQRPESAPGDADLFAILYHNMLDMDPPDHTRLRSIVSKAFTPQRIMALEPRIQQIADDLIDAFPASGQIDLIDAYAFPLPITVIAEILGIPAADRDKFRVWSNAFIGGMDMNYFELMMEFIQYIATVVGERRRTPQDDLISALIQAEEDGDRLTEQELFSMIVLLIVAGHETTVNLIASGTLALLQHPDQLRQLQQNPHLTENAIEEFLRYNGAVDHTTARYAAEDVTIAGEVIPRGSGIIISLVAANRDPRQFDHPHTLDITRDNTKHLDFGYGVHYCLGAPLARLEGRVAVNTLLRRVSYLQLAVPVDRLRYRDSNVVRGLVKLPVQFNAVIERE